MTGTFAFAVGLLLVLSADAQSVVLELKNGDRLSGWILSESTNRLVLSNRWSSAVTVPLAEVVRRVPLPASVAAVPPPAISEAAPSRATNSPPPGGAPVAFIPKNGVAPKRPKHWSGEGEIGLDLNYSTRSREVLYGRGKVSYVDGPLRSGLDYTANYGRGAGVVNANNMLAFSKTDYDVGKRWYFYNLAGVGYDEIRRVDLQYEEGPGVGYRWLKLPNLVVNTEAGAQYQAEWRSDDTHPETFYGRFSENSTWKLASRISLEQRFEFFPRIETPEQYRMRFESTLRFWLMANLSLNLSVFDYYDSAPARGVPPNELQIRSSVGVKF